MNNRFLPGVPQDDVAQACERAPGDETADRHFEQVSADPPAESELQDLPIDGEGKRHRMWKAVGIAVLAACGVMAVGTIAFVLVAFGSL
ncbi:MAG: hypothetical protein OXS50_12840 [Gammaproteobacteria bacterium]|nr:hypothetical protein [Gammaproteobacteria bacterium]